MVRPPGAYLLRLASGKSDQLQALDDGVPDDKLARALARSVTTIRMSRTMLKDICPEAIELLKDKPPARDRAGVEN